MNFGIAKMFGAIDKKFQDRYNYLVEILSSYASNLASDISLLIRKDGGALYPFTAMPYVGTAPIIESGSNANGYYFKYADGTMICTHELTTTAGNGASGALWISNDALSWTYPIEFYAKPVVSANVDKLSVAGANPVSVSRPSSAAFTKTAFTDCFVWYDSSNAAVRTVVSFIAIGRWKA